MTGDIVSTRRNRQGGRGKAGKLTQASDHFNVCLRIRTVSICIADHSSHKQARCRALWFDGPIFDRLLAITDLLSVREMAPSAVYEYAAAAWSG